MAKRWLKEEGHIANLPRPGSLAFEPFKLLVPRILAFPGPPLSIGHEKPRPESLRQISTPRVRRVATCLVHLNPSRLLETSIARARRVATRTLSTVRMARSFYWEVMPIPDIG